MTLMLCGARGWQAPTHPNGAVAKGDIVDVIDLYRWSDRISFSQQRGHTHPEDKLKSGLEVYISIDRSVFRSTPETYPPVLWNYKNQTMSVKSQWITESLQNGGSIARTNRMPAWWFELYASKLTRRQGETK